MNITIEQNQVIVNLDEVEFPLFEAMFANLQLNKRVQCEFREFGFGGTSISYKLLPMHLCRTIGEANLSADPFATVSLYPFWKHGFAFGKDTQLSLGLDIDDPHKKAVAADEFGMGFCAWVMEEVFDCEMWADTSALIKKGAVFPVGSKRPDFVCTFADGSLGVFEAKGTTGTAGELSGPLADGKTQTQGIGAQAPIKYRVVVGCALGGDKTKVIIMDPEPAGLKPTNLTADLVKRAAKQMRTPSAFGISPVHGGEKEGVTIFRGPGGQIKLTRDEYREGKRHGWLSIDA